MFDRFWPFLANFGHFWLFWPFLTIFLKLSLTVFDRFDLVFFYRFWPLLTFLTVFQRFFLMFLTIFFFILFIFNFFSSMLWTFLTVLQKVDIDGWWMMNDGRKYRKYRKYTLMDDRWWMKEESTEITETTYRHSKSWFFAQSKH